VPGAIATAYVKLIPTFDGQLSSTISKQLGGVDGKSAGAKVGSDFGQGVEVGASSIGSAISGKLSGWSVAWGNIVSNVLTSAATMVGQSIGEAFGSYADYEQLVGGVDTLFKDSSATVQEYAANAYATAGLSANQYMEQVTSFSASLLQGLGGDTEEAARIADMAIIDMADNANKMGSSMESIQNAYQGFAKQNYTMLDNLKLGYGGTKSEMERLLADASELAGTKFDIDNYNDVIEAIHVMQKQMGIAGTTSEEALSTISGSVNQTKAAWQNLLTGLFDEKADVGALFDRFAESAGAALKNILPRIGVLIGRMLEGIPDAIAKVFLSLPDVLSPALEKMFGERGLEVIENLREAFDTLGGMAEKTFAPFIEKIAPGLEQAAKGASEFFGPIGEFFQGQGTAFAGMMERIQGHFSDMSPLLGDLAAHFNDLCSRLEPIAGPLGEAAAEVVGNLLSAIVGLGTVAVGILDAIVGSLDALFKAADDFANGAGDAFNWLVENMGAIPPGCEYAVWGLDNVTDAANRIPSDKTVTVKLNDQISDQLNSIAGKLASIGTTHIASVYARFFGKAAGGFAKLHASGGFVTDGPTYLGRDAFGVAHIAGEAGREWIKTHADGTTSIVPIENRRYLKPYAEEIASMIGGGSSTVYNISIDGARINDDPAIREAFLSFMGEVNRKKAMNVG